MAAQSNPKVIQSKWYTSQTKSNSKSPKWFIPPKWNTMADAAAKAEALEVKPSKMWPWMHHYKTYLLSQMTSKRTKWQQKINGEIYCQLHFLQSALKEIVKLKDKGNVPFFLKAMKWSKIKWNVCTIWSLNEMHVLIYWNYVSYQNCVVSYQN